jgi:hypothetical protein
MLMSNRFVGRHSAFKHYTSQPANDLSAECFGRITGYGRGRLIPRTLQLRQRGTPPRRRVPSIGTRGRAASCSFPVVVWIEGVDLRQFKQDGRDARPAFLEPKAS